VCSLIVSESLEIYIYISCKIINKIPVRWFLSRADCECFWPVDNVDDDNKSKKMIVWGWLIEIALIDFRKSIFKTNLFRTRLFEMLFKLDLIETKIDEIYYILKISLNNDVLDCFKGLLYFQKKKIEIWKCLIYVLVRYFILIELIGVFFCIRTFILC